MAIQAKQTMLQRLLLAPNITLALEVLRMTNMELQTFLERQLEENPLLELEEPERTTAAESQAETAPTEAPAEPDAPTSALDDDWMNRGPVSDTTLRSEDEEGGEERTTERQAAAAETLYELLRMQLLCQPLADEESRLALAIIDHLEPSGYLAIPLEELGTELGAAAERMERALHLVQQLDPPGVAARDLRECLRLQLEDRREEDTLAYRILQEHFDDFTANRLSVIARATAAPLEDVQEACRTLRRLNPKPGCPFGGDLPPSIVPDLILHRRERHYDVELNEQPIPQLKISRAYYRMLKDPRTPPDAKEFLTEKFRKAGWLIKAIDERNSTVLSIARCLIGLQSAFLEQGPRALKPLTQAQVAGLVGRHPSTVSRAIAGKTLDTPYGIFRLEQFFASAVPQAEGPQALSDEYIKSEIQQLVTAEDPRRPLSDAVIVQRLAQRHIVVARRTIAKYRTSLKILPAHLRRRRF